MSKQEKNTGGKPSGEEVSALYERLKPLQEKKGYFFNKNLDHTFMILEGLLVNKERYGYMSCPCRLACGERDWDEDIICPCDYRAPDVEEFGSCYCNLYVSKEWNEGSIPFQHIPERRPPEKMKY
jgi:ferredoxin-thioredoxin reductase catalytic chain